MYIQKIKIKCENCFKPAMRRLANFRANDEYECYAESYIKYFWGLCDHQTSSQEFITESSGQVITEQPLPQEIPFQELTYSQKVNFLKIKQQVK